MTTTTQHFDFRTALERIRASGDPDLTEMNRSLHRDLLADIAAHYATPPPAPPPPFRIRYVDITGQRGEIDQHTIDPQADDSEQCAQDLAATLNARTTTRFHYASNQPKRIDLP